MGNKQNSCTNNYSIFMNEFNQRWAADFNADGILSVFLKNWSRESWTLASFFPWYRSLHQAVSLSVALRTCKTLCTQITLSNTLENRLRWSKASFISFIVKVLVGGLWQSLPLASGGILFFLLHVNEIFIWHRLWIRCIFNADTQLQFIHKVNNFLREVLACLTDSATVQ